MLSVGPILTSLFLGNVKSHIQYVGLLVLDLHKEHKEK
jgi:hypothetical protein